MSTAIKFSTPFGLKVIHNGVRYDIEVTPLYCKHVKTSKELKKYKRVFHEGAMYKRKTLAKLWNTSQYNAKRILKDLIASGCVRNIARENTWCNVYQVIPTKKALPKPSHPDLRVVSSENTLFVRGWMFRKSYSVITKNNVTTAAVGHDPTHRDWVWRLTYDLNALLQHFNEKSTCISNTFADMQGKIAKNSWDTASAAAVVRAGKGIAIATVGLCSAWVCSGSETPKKIIEPHILRGDEPGVGTAPDRKLPLLGGVFPTNRGIGASIYETRGVFSCTPTIVSHEWSDADEYVQIQIGPYHDTMITSSTDFARIVPCECPEYERRMNYLCVKITRQHMDQ